MEDNGTGRKLHDRATCGETLSEEERTELEHWYAQQDAEESKMLTANLSTLPTIMSQQIDDALMQIQATTERIRLLTAENAVLRREIEMRKQ